MQTGKKKLVLDHLIFQNMGHNDSDKDVQSILMFGAQTLFEQGDAQSAKDIHCERNLIRQRAVVSYYPDRLRGRHSAAYRKD